MGTATFADTLQGLQGPAQEKGEGHNGKED
jgi:hypothetical protein